MQENELKMGQITLGITPLNPQSHYLTSPSFALIKLRRPLSPAIYSEGNLIMAIDLPWLALPSRSAATTTKFALQPKSECPKFIIDDKLLKGPILLVCFQILPVLFKKQRLEFPAKISSLLFSLKNLIDLK